LTGDRTRCWNRLEKLLEDALIKLTSVASSIDTVSGREMIEALIAGQRDPRVLAGLARGRMRVKHAALVEAMSGRFDDHHGELARLLLDQIDALSAQIERLTTRIDELIASNPAAGAPAGPQDHDPSAGSSAALPAVDRLDEIPGLGRRGAQIILAEVGLDMTRFPTPEQMVSWARLCPRTIQSGPKTRKGKTGKGNRYLKGALGEAAAAVAKTDTFLGARYRQLVKRKGKLKALVAVARSILVIVWHLLADPNTRYQELGADYHSLRIDKQRKTRDHVRQLEALGYTVTLTATAA
jgi:transposase